jgi:RHS repeat-associated protein
VKELHGTHESAYEYDGASRRVKITEKENGVQTKQETFVWCGSRICQNRASNGSTVLRSYFGNGFEESGPTKYFYTRDHLGSVREVVGSDGTTIASRLSYDPWGKVTETGSGALSDFTYTGHHFDRPTGLNLAQYRGYDSQLGRWLSRDPIDLAGGLNLYGYVENDPIKYLDPSGEAPMDGATMDRTSGSPQDWNDTNFQSGLIQGGIAGALLDGAVIGSIAGWEAVGLRIVGGTATNWIGLARQGAGQLVHIGRHPLPMKDLTVLLGRTLAGAVRSRPLIHIGIGARHFPLNPLLYLRAWLGLIALMTASETNSCGEDSR